jgi:hypothetical protein
VAAPQFCWVMGDIIITWSTRRPESLADGHPICSDCQSACCIRSPVEWWAPAASHRRELTSVTAQHGHYCAHRPQRSTAQHSTAQHSTDHSAPTANQQHSTPAAKQRSSTAPERLRHAARQVVHAGGHVQRRRPVRLRHVALAAALPLSRRCSHHVCHHLPQRHHLGVRLRPRCPRPRLLPLPAALLAGVL